MSHGCHDCGSPNSCECRCDQCRRLLWGPVLETCKYSSLPAPPAPAPVRADSTARVMKLRAAVEEAYKRMGTLRTLRFVEDVLDELADDDAS